MVRTTVRDVMTSPVESVPPSAGFKEIVARLRERRISAVPVVDVSGQVVGVVSEADLLLKEERGSQESKVAFGDRLRGRALRAKVAGSIAAELMTSPAITVRADVTVAEAARILHRHGLKRLPVVDEEDHAIGIVSRGDLLRVFLRDDEDIRREVVDEIVPSLQLAPEMVEVGVEAGIVRLSGQVDRRSDVRLVERMTLQLDGVVDVRNGLTYRFDDTRVRAQPPPDPDPWLLRS